MSTTVTCAFSPLTGASGCAGATIEGAADAGADVVVPAAVCDATGDFVPCVDVAAGVSGWGAASFGKSFGAPHCRIAMNTIEMRTAVTSRFSILGDGVPTSRIEHVAARQTS